MGGVDRLNQNISAYMIFHRSKKWCLPIFRFFLDMPVSNVYQIYRYQETIPKVIITVTGLIRVTNEGVVAATKRQNNFVKN